MPFNLWITLKETVDMYPNGVAIIRARATKQPVVTVTPDAVRADVKGYIEVFVKDQTTGQENFLFSADVVSLLMIILL